MDSSKQLRFLSKPRAAFAAKVHRWARKRQGEDRLPVTLHARRIYILPTRSGAVAAVLLFVMLLAGMNYNNSLALFLCFLLCGVTLVSMHECHRTLAGLKIVRAKAQDTFATRLGELQIHFENVDRRTRRALTVRCSPCDEARFHLTPGSLLAVRVPYQAGRRGRHPIDRLELSTHAPLGLFRAWTWLYLPLEATIYPAPNGTRVLPPQQGEPRAGRRQIRNNGEEEWAWLRGFQDSDSPRSVAWKAYARGAPLMVAHYHSPAAMQRLLNFDPLRGLSTEHKLSQLSLWVLECERLGENYALQLPARSIAVGHGLAQRRECLEALAHYGL
jgi:uncharacterized protein (DUF58 family)